MKTELFEATAELRSGGFSDASKVVLNLVDGVRFPKLSR